MRQQPRIFCPELWYPPLSLPVIQETWSLKVNWTANSWALNRSPSSSTRIRFLQSPTLKWITCLTSRLETRLCFNTMRSRCLCQVASIYPRAISFRRSSKLSGKTPQVAKANIAYSEEDLLRFRTLRVTRQILFEMFHRHTTDRFIMYHKSHLKTTKFLVHKSEAKTLWIQTWNLAWQILKVSSLAIFHHLIATQWPSILNNYRLF